MVPPFSVVYEAAADLAHFATTGRAQSSSGKALGGRAIRRMPLAPAKQLFGAPILRASFFLARSAGQTLRFVPYLLKGVQASYKDDYLSGARVLVVCRTFRLFVQRDVQ
ncbi:MAG: hypothetical protein IPL91_09790 [Hyphomicrobium sp.]|jgi:hypothetical protein|nr:hypothetical protein [Hyphomicrobium sp.]